MLTEEQKKRYDRNIRLRRVGEAGQEKMLNARVLIIGAGGLGSPVILYLAAGGVGSLTIADDDQVSISNLQRQILYRVSDHGLPKAEVAVKQVMLLNPDVQATAITERITEINLSNLMVEQDFIVECSDNVETKFLVNDLCVRMRKSFCHSGVVGMAGQIMTYVPGHACIRCAFDVPNPASMPTSNELGILGPAAGTLGALQAAEAIKYLTGSGKLLTDTFLHIDITSCTWKKVKVKRDRKCICHTKM